MIYIPPVTTPGMPGSSKPQDPLDPFMETIFKISPDKAFPENQPLGFRVFDELKHGDTNGPAMQQFLDQWGNPRTGIHSTGNDDLIRGFNTVQTSYQNRDPAPVIHDHLHNLFDDVRSNYVDKHPTPYVDEPAWWSGGQLRMYPPSPADIPEPK